MLVGRLRKGSKEFDSYGFRGVRLRCWFDRGFLFYAEYNIRLFFFLLTTRFDVVCACDLDTALAVRGAAFFKRKDSVYDAHEYFSEVPELSGRPFVKSVWSWIGKMTIPRFKACYTVGDELAKLMGEKFGVHFDVIRNIAPRKEITAAEPIEKRGNVLLYQGALNVGRGLEVCIGAMRQLPDWMFWLAGEGDITTQLKEMAVEYGVENRVKFLGWVHPDDLPLLMLQAKLSINLRETGSLNDYYSLPNKFFDALHAGLPSIHMKYPEYVSIISKHPCALMLDHVDEYEVVSAIESLSRNPEQLRAMSLACAAAAIEYSWEKESQKLIQIYRDLLQ